jgi:hypothetical protein
MTQVYGLLFTRKAVDVGISFKERVDALVWALSSLQKVIRWHMPLMPHRGRSTLLPNRGCTAIVSTISSTEKRWGVKFTSSDCLPRRLKARDVCLLHWADHLADQVLYLPQESVKPLNLVI